MKVDGRHIRSIWLEPDGHTVGAIDQRLDLWTGTIYSTYTLAGQPVTVETVAHLADIAVNARSRPSSAGTTRATTTLPSIRR